MKYVACFGASPRLVPGSPATAAVAVAGVVVGGARLSSFANGCPRRHRALALASETAQGLSPCQGVSLYRWTQSPAPPTESRGLPPLAFATIFPQPRRSVEQTF